MALRISNVRAPVDEPEAALIGRLARKLGLGERDIVSWRILRKSLDARSRMDLQFVYSAVVELADEAGCLKSLDANSDVDTYLQKHFDEFSGGSEPLAERPVVVGSGPAGLLAGYYLAIKGYRPIILERGQAVKERVPAIREFDEGGAFDRENNYLFGEGGAGTFSDGKLTCRMSGPDVDWVLRQIVECGGKPSSVYEHRPHLGSNRLPLVVRNFRRKIEAAGGEYRFGCRLETLQITDDRITGVMTSGGQIKTSQVILAIGHSARDTYQMLYDLGIPMQPKAFQLGLRIEQPQEQVNRHKYGHERYLEILGAADYTLVARGQKDIYTFCMCAGGIIIPSISEPEMFCTNGMSNSRRDTPFANSGVMVTIEPSEFGSAHPLAGVELQRRYESLAFQIAGRNYYCPIQTADDFLASQPARPAAHLDCSYKRGTTAANLIDVIPPEVAKSIQQGLPLLDKKWKGEFLRNAILVGPEMRGSSPVRIERDRETWQSPACAGLYPVGEGAGFAGGIISAAVDGLRSAKKIVERFAPLEMPVG